MKTAFDANIIISALHVPVGAPFVDEPDHRCLSLVRQADPPRIAAPAWFEIVRCAQPEEQQQLAALAPHVWIDDIDRQVLARAVLLQQQAASDGGALPIDVCQRCSNARDATMCIGCRRLVRNRTRVVDYFVVASAECNPEITILYSTDGSVLSMAGRVRSTLSIQRPPASASGALFERAAGGI